MYPESTMVDEEGKSKTVVLNKHWLIKEEKEISLNNNQDARKWASVLNVHLTCSYTLSLLLRELPLLKLECLQACSYCHLFDTSVIILVFVLPLECHKWLAASISACLRRWPRGYSRSGRCIGGSTARNFLTPTHPLTWSTWLERPQIPFFKSSVRPDQVWNYAFQWRILKALFIA